MDKSVKKIKVKRSKLVDFLLDSTYDCYCDYYETSKLADKQKNLCVYFWYTFFAILLFPFIFNFHCLNFIVKRIKPYYGVNFLVAFIINPVIMIVGMAVLEIFGLLWILDNLSYSNPFSFATAWVLLVSIGSLSLVVLMLCVVLASECFINPALKFVENYLNTKFPAHLDWCILKIKNLFPKMNWLKSIKNKLCIPLEFTE